MNNILVVDSNEGFAALLRESLEQSGAYRATVAVSGDEALQALASAEFDLAIVDLGLSEPDGITLARTLRERNANLRLMLIPLVGEELPPETADLTVQGILPKPFFLPELPGRIAEALARRVGESVSDARGEDADAKAADSTSPVPPVPAGGGVRRFVGSAERLNAVRHYVVEITQKMKGLAQEINAESVILTSDAELLAQTGRLPVEKASELAQAVAENWRTSARVAQVLGQAQSRFEQSTEGGEHLFYSLVVAEDIILSVAMRAGVPLGMIRHRVKEAADALRTLIG
jgi:CheY-like chemotaxis protein